MLQKEIVPSCKNDFVKVLLEVVEHCIELVVHVFGITCLVLVLQYGHWNHW